MTNSHWTKSVLESSSTTNNNNNNTFFSFILQVLELVVRVQTSTQRIKRIQTFN